MNNKRVYLFLKLGNSRSRDLNVMWSMNPPEVVIKISISHSVSQMPEASIKQYCLQAKTNKQLLMNMHLCTLNVYLQRR